MSSEVQMFFTLTIEHETGKISLRGSDGVVSIALDRQQVDGWEIGDYSIRIKRQHRRWWPKAPIINLLSWMKVRSRKFAKKRKQDGVIVQFKKPDYTVGLPLFDG